MVDPVWVLLSEQIKFTDPEINNYKISSRPIWRNIRQTTQSAKHPIRTFKSTFKTCPNLRTTSPVTIPLSSPRWVSSSITRNQELTLAVQAVNCTRSYLWTPWCLTTDQTSWILRTMPLCSHSSLLTSIEWNLSNSSQCKILRHLACQWILAPTARIKEMVSLILVYKMLSKGSLQNQFSKHAPLWVASMWLLSSKITQSQRQSSSNRRFK